MMQVWQSFWAISPKKALDKTYFLLISNNGFKKQMFAKLLQGNVENNMLGLLIIPLRDLAAKHQDWLKNP